MRSVYDRGGSFIQSSFDFLIRHFDGFFIPPERNGFSEVKLKKNSPVIIFRKSTTEKSGTKFVRC